MLMLEEQLGALILQWWVSDANTRYKNYHTHLHAQIADRKHITPSHHHLFLP